VLATCGTGIRDVELCESKVRMLRGSNAGLCLELEAGEDGLQVNVLFSQVAQSDLRGAHKLVEGIDAPRQFFFHGYDNAVHVSVVCKNDGVVSDLHCTDTTQVRDFLFKGVDARSESFDFLLSVCSELLGLQYTDSGGLQFGPSRTKTDW
jgi:hypothetical protein